MESGCPFCTPETERVFYESELVVGLWDRYPVSPGHALMVPRRHVGGWFDASQEEQQALIAALEVAKREIEKNHEPDSYNIGVNSGEAAGQTVLHLHLHLIPRYTGDEEDPRGGIRKLFPGRARYWEHS
ncbi:MAG TPA: HIT family protein [Alphaproteobacteria bacterium]|nr:HIT family protein [Alphaproteobacteria bacterium]